MAYTKPTGVNSLWAASGDKITVPSAKVSAGWVAEKPSYQYFNQILYNLGLYDAYANERGIVEWDSGTEYQADKSYIVGSDGNLYKCLVTDSGIDPTLDDGTNWQLILRSDGMTEWSALVSYPEGAVVLYSDGDLYEATTTTTVGSVPGVSSDWWVYERNGDLSALISANTTIIETLDDNKLDASGVQSVTGSATFTNSTNNINLTGIGENRENGDVIEVVGSANNDKIFTIDEVVDVNNVIVNKYHKGGSSKLSLTDETATVTVSLVCKWYVASDTIGRNYAFPTDLDFGVTYTNSSSRSILVVVASTDGTAGNLSTINGYVDGNKITQTSAAGTDSSTSVSSLAMTVPAYSTFQVDYGAEDTEYLEYRVLS